MCRSAAAASVALNRARKCNTCGYRLAMDGVCPSAYAFSVASRGSACFAALTPDCGHCKSQCSTSSRATPMAHLHTLLRLNRLLPCLRFTAHRHRHFTKSSLKASSRHDFVLPVVGKPTILKSGSQSAPPKPPLRFGSSSHIGDFTAHRPAYSARLKGDFVVSSVGRSVGLGRQPRGKAPNPIKGCITAFSLFQSLTNCGFW